MTNAKRVVEADVYRNAERVGSIRRTETGSVFAYADDFYAAHANTPGGIARHLLYRNKQTETRGYNLHPYFAGLLPEGIRLKALVRREKTSEDDMLTLLIGAGSDTVGDLSVVKPGVTPVRGRLKLDPTEAEHIRFADVWKQAIEGRDADIAIAAFKRRSPRR